jgi:hypothetical protein
MTRDPAMEPAQITRGTLTLAEEESAASDDSDGFEICPDRIAGPTIDLFEICIEIIDIICKN